MNRVLALAAAQIVVVLGWAGYQERVWATAPTFRIPLAPRDPYDIVRGRYFVLNPRDAQLEPGAGPLTPEALRALVPEGEAFFGQALAGFCPSEDGWRVCALAPAGVPPPAGPAAYWSRAFVQVSPGSSGERPSVRVDLGLRRFFLPNRVRLPVPESTAGWELEVSHRPGQVLLPRRLFFGGEAAELR